MSGLGSVAIVREIYDSESPEETFECNLERALEVGYETIIIEPARLGEETARWIRVGNGLHKGAVLLGISSICLGIYSSHGSANAFVIPLSMGSVVCASLYMISWQFDPCCKYQIATDADVARLKSAPGGDALLRHLSASFELAADSSAAPAAVGVGAVGGVSISVAPTVLVRKDDTARKLMHSAIASVALALAVFRFCSKRYQLSDIQYIDRFRHFKSRSN